MRTRLMAIASAQAATFVLVAMLYPEGGWAQCQILWNGAQTSESGTRTYAIATGDFNGDGVVDLATAGRDLDQLAILTGLGTGLFQNPAGNQIYTVGDEPMALSVEDFNEDGIKDIAVVHNNSTNLRVLLGNGNGTFQNPVSFDMGYGSQSIVKGDFNEDGKIDLAVVRYNGDSSNIGVFLRNNNAPATLFSACQVASALSFERPVAMAVGDINGDDHLDIAVLRTPCCFSSRVRLLFGNGNGTFVSGGDYSLTSGVSYGIGAGDFNLDGFSDLAVANYDNDTVTILLSGTGGSLKPFAYYFVGDEPGTSSTCLVVNDIDTDGFLDIALTCRNENTVKILRGNGSGSFTNGGKPQVGHFPVSLVVDDLNNDGRKDIVAANYTSDIPYRTQVSTLLNSSTNSPLITQQPASRHTWDGYNASFSISATNAVSYQWRFNATNLSNGSGISGANGPVLTIIQPSIANVGLYDCVVANACGSVESQDASLDIDPDCLGDFNRDGRFDSSDLGTVVELLLAGEPGCLPCK